VKKFTEDTIGNIGAMSYGEKLDMILMVLDTLNESERVAMWEAVKNLSCAKIHNAVHMESLREERKAKAAP
jgi:hypothetical protein